MEITDIKIKVISNDERVKAIVSILIDGQFAVHEIRVIQGDKRMFVSMPSRRLNEAYMDIAHPVNQTARDYVEQEILKKYKEYIDNRKQ